MAGRRKTIGKISASDRDPQARSGTEEPGPCDPIFVCKHKAYCTRAVHLLFTAQICRSLYKWHAFAKHIVPDTNPLFTARIYCSLHRYHIFTKTLVHWTYSFFTAQIYR
jgi:hypothetical protein